MPEILEWTHTVVERDLDGLGHANNISYLKWMQSAALPHSENQRSAKQSDGTLEVGVFCGTLLLHLRPPISTSRSIP